MSYVLNTLGYALNDKNVWIRSDYRSIAYNDGDEAEQRIAEIIQQASDISVLSAELRRHCTDWPSTYHLSSLRANILRPFQRDLAGDILEIGSGCGAITRYLGECGARVLALEGSERRAAMTRSRARDLDNVDVLCESFDDFRTDRQFDVITLIGVLEYANLFTQDGNPHLALLRRARSLLKPRGTLFLAIENQLGLKYFAGAPEDHIGLPMYGVEGRYQQNQPQTFGRQTLTRLLIQAGFDRNEFFAPFPDYKLPVSIVSEHGMANAQFDASALAWQSANSDPQLPALTHFALELAWPEVFDNGLALDMSNSFLVRAAGNDVEPMSPGLLAWHYSTGRVAQYCKESLFRLQGADEVGVNYTRLQPPHGAPSPRVPGAPISHAPISPTLKRDSPIIRFVCPAAAPYESGHTLSWEFVKIVSREGWRISDVSDFVRRHVFLLGELDLYKRQKIDWSRTHEVLPETSFDLVPQNIVIRADDTPAAIDLEWNAPGGIELGRLLFRSMLLLIAAVRRFGMCASAPTLSRRDFVMESLGGAGYELTSDDFARFIQQEAMIQESVTGMPAQQFLDWRPDDPLPMRSYPGAHDTVEPGLAQALHEKDVHIVNLEALVAELEKKVKAQHGKCESLQTALNKEHSDSENLSARLRNLVKDIAGKDGVMTEQKHQIDNKEKALHDKETHIQNLNAMIEDQLRTIAALSATVDALKSSTSWKLTAPLRWPIDQMRRIVRVVRMLPAVLQRGGGLHATARKAMLVAQREGLAGVRHQLGQMEQQLIAVETDDDAAPFVHRNDYAEWVRRYDTIDQVRRNEIQERIAAMPRKPHISILMPVYDPPLDFLDQAIWSVRRQLYPEWELCIADDASKNEATRDLLKKHASEDDRIKTVFRRSNGHISQASNSALELATGEFIALMDHDDTFAEHALFHVAEAILEHPDAGLIYSDEDKIDASGRRQDAYFKPDWNPDLFLSQNMISHLGAYRTTLVKELQGFRKGLEGSQDYDLALRCIEHLDATQIIHIPKILYHWRIHAGSTALAGSEKGYAFVAGQRALNDHFRRTGVAAQAGPQECGMYRVRYALPERPLVSIIVPTRNGLRLIRQCISSVLAKTQYDHYEILIVDNNSNDEATLAYLAQLENDARVRILRDPRPFNYSALNNAAVRQARGEYLCLMNNDIEVIAPEWLSEMVSIARQPGVGAVGAKLRYPDDTLQHGGVITGIGGVASHAHKHFPVSHHGYFGRAQLIHTVSAVTAACMLIKKEIYEQMGGLDDKNLPIAFNDVDFCLRIREAGYRNVWTPYADLYHHESASRGHDNTPEKQARFQSEVAYMHAQWGESLRADPSYNPNLTLDHDDFSLAWPPRAAALPRRGLPGRGRPQGNTFVSPTAAG